MYHLVFELGEWLDGRVWPDEDELDVLRLVDFIEHCTGANTFPSFWVCWVAWYLFACFLCEFDSHQSHTNNVEECVLWAGMIDAQGNPPDQIWWSFSSVNFLLYLLLDSRQLSHEMHYQYPCPNARSPGRLHWNFFDFDKSCTGFPKTQVAYLMMAYGVELWLSNPVASEG